MSANAGPVSSATAPAVPEVPAEAVTPLIRGISVLLRLTEADGMLSLSGLERATGLARSTVDRITATLERMDYVRLDGRDAVLAPGLMELGNAYLSALRLPRLLSGYADALADELDESVSLAVADGDGIRFIHQATRRRAMSLSFRIGDLLPAERTAPGPLFATEWQDADWARWRLRRTTDPEDRGFPAVPPRELLDESGDGPAADFEIRTAAARTQDWSLDDQLIEPGLVAISVPVRDVTRATADNRIACVASVVSHTSRHTAGDLRDTLLPRLRATVATMEHALRKAPAPEPRPAPGAGLAAWTGASKQELGRGFVESLARGLTVLTAFGEGRAELTLTDVARATGLARATARRALITLEHLGQVTAHGRTFSPTPRVLALGFPPLSRTTLARIAEPHLAELATRVQDSTSMAILTGEDIQYTARVATGRIMSAHITLGTRRPAHATALGRAILAALPTTDLPPPLAQVRQSGYALVEEELEEGLRTIAVPIRDRTGTPTAAINVAMHTSRRTPEQCETEVLPHLRTTATRIETDLHTATRFARIPPT